MYTLSRNPARTQTLSILIGASVMLSLSMGMRQSLGLFMPPVTRELGLSAGDFTFAIAIQNIVWGVTQPLFGALADRWGTRLVTLGGTLVYVAGLAVTALAEGPLALCLGMGLLIGIALSCTAASIAMSASARTATTAEARSLVFGIVSAAGSLGSFIAAPLAAGLISAEGWRIALVAFIGLAAAMLPAGFVTGRADRLPVPALRGGALALKDALGEALGHRGFVTTALAFFVCGLQLVFITTHLPTYIAACGLDPMLGAETLAVIGFFNIGGSYLFGWLGSRYPNHLLLGLIYLLRSLIITLYFTLPVSGFSTLLFAAAIGLLWLGVVPLVNGLVARMFGLQYLATLSGIAFFSHQLGSFLGAWGGGLIYDALGSYTLAWQLAVGVGFAAGCAQIMADVRPSPRMAAAAAE
jgi:predicted MFS family arabinose efflux permease